MNLMNLRWLFQKDMGGREQLEKEHLSRTTSQFLDDSVTLPKSHNNLPC